MRIPIIIGLVLVSAANHCAAKDKLFVRVSFRDNISGVYEFIKYDDKKFRFEFKSNDQKETWRIAKISSIAFDTTLLDCNCPTDSIAGDRIRYRSGSEIPALISKMDRKKFQVSSTVRGDKRSIPVASIKSFCFNPSVLNVDRLDYASGFNLLDSSTIFQLAEVSAAEIEQQAPMLSNPIVDGYLDSLTKYIGKFSKQPGTVYACKAINSDEVNAFTVGGGMIFIYRGLLEKLGSEAELAGVLAHEIGHNVGNHTSQQLSKRLLYTGIIEASGILLNQAHNRWVQSLKEAGGAVAFFALMKYSRDDEREADLLGFYNMYQAGFDPHGMLTLFDTFKKLPGSSGSTLDQWGATHPKPSERQENVSVELSEIDADGLTVDADQFDWIKNYVSALPPPQLTMPVWVESMNIGAGQYVARILDLAQATTKNPTLKGRFLASGGSRNDIKFHIMDEVNYVNWANGNKATELFGSDKVTLFDLDYKFPKPAKYYLIFDNRDAILSGKQVTADIHLSYTAR